MTHDNSLVPVNLPAAGPVSIPGAARRGRTWTSGARAPGNRIIYYYNIAYLAVHALGGTFKCARNNSIMAVAWRRASTPSLHSQGWRVLAVGGKQYLIKALFEDQGYHVMISDLSVIWEEDIGAEKIIIRGKVK